MRIRNLLLTASVLLATALVVYGLYAYWRDRYDCTGYLGGSSMMGE
ncbi:MAG: hypothetical protein ACJ74Q_15340 [Pyrinomonadaceae bacterium]